MMVTFFFCACFWWLMLLFWRGTWVIEVVLVGGVGGVQFLSILFFSVLDWDV